MKTSNEKIKSLDKAISNMAERIKEIKNNNEKITKLIKTQDCKIIQVIND